MAVLVIAEQEAGALKPGAAATAAAAARIGGDIHLLIAGEGAADAAAGAGFAGVAKILIAEATPPLAEPLADLVVRLAPGYGHVLAPATTFGKNVAPRIAALLDVAQISEIVEVIAPDTFVRPIYAGNALATVQSRDPVKVATVRPSAFDDAPMGVGAVVEAIESPADAGLSKRLRAELSVSERPELAAARGVVSGGRALGSSEEFHAVMDPLADKLGAAVGASRAAVDAGYAPNDYQVGQTGKIVAPELYIAIGISGAIQHLAGMKDSKVIVAINKDPEAPIFQIADYGWVTDYKTAVPELMKALG